MKKYIYGIIGILIGFSLSLTITTHASDIGSLIGRTVQGEIPIKINSMNIPQKVIVIDSVSYIPVRTISTILGLSINYDTKSGIELTQTPAGSFGATMGNFMKEMGITQSDLDAYEKQHKP